MLIKNIKSENFRNLNEVSLNLAPRVNVFIGDNGQGKTNLLELIYFFCRGETFRYAKTENLVRKEGEKNSLNKSNSKGSMSLTCGDLDYHLEYSILGNSKNFRINGKRTSLLQLRKLMSCVHFSPESLSAIKAGPEERRKLVDDLLASHDIRNTDILGDFKKVLKSRNKILKNHKLDLIPFEETSSLLESIEPIYLASALRLTEARISAIRAIQPEVQKAMVFILGESDVDISVDYVISSNSAISMGTDDLRRLFELRIKELRSSELTLGMSLVGPHKHDIHFLFNGEDSRSFCSQGQQRAMILSFKMAHIVYHYRENGEFPLLLLDDVLSELDLKKRSNLITFLKDISSQIIITTTDFDLHEKFEKTNVSVFSLDSGSILSQ